MKRLISFILCFAFSATLHAADADRAKQTVQAFYRYHFAHDMSFTPAQVQASARWLTPQLLTLARDYFAKPGSPDVVPDVDGDPFTDTQEYPKSFRIERVEMAGDTARATVRFAGGGGRPHTVRVVLRPGKDKEAWLIDDVAYDTGPSLQALLAGSVHR